MKTPCDGCGKEYALLTRGIIKAKFGDYCFFCVNESNRSVSPGHAQYSRDRDREDNLKDLIQPWRRDGKPNQEFIRNYREEAENMFSSDELREYG